MFPKDTGVSIPREPSPVGAYNGADSEIPFPHLSTRSLDTPAMRHEYDVKDRVLYSGKYHLTDEELPF